MTSQNLFFSRYPKFAKNVLRNMDMGITGYTMLIWTNENGTVDRDLPNHVVPIVFSR